jgi:hypothetical protein
MRRSSRLDGTVEDIRGRVPVVAVDGEGTAVMTTKPAWTGWITFAAIMFLITGTVNIVEGIVALIQDNYVVVVQDDLYLVDVTGWGWVLLLLGIVLVAAGLGLFSGMTWARITAIIVAALHASLQVLWIGAYPLWSILMIALDVVVIFALTARWTDQVDDAPYEPLAQPISTPTVHPVPPPARR